MDNINNAEKCSSCGACVAACPKGIISLVQQEPGKFKGVIVDRGKCSACGLCATVCPWQNGETISDNVIASYSVYSADKEIRKNSTSGGFVSSLICELLGNGDYERAYCVEYPVFNGEVAKLKPVASREDVLACAKSKYIPVSIENVVSAIREGCINRSIVVCTPCQLRAIKNAIKVFHREMDDVLFVGLFCGKVMNYDVFKHYEKHFGKFAKLNFRDKRPTGWPGDTALEGADGKVRFVNRKVRMQLKKIYPSGFCEGCIDKLNAGADISVGDCYVPMYSRLDGDLGLSSVILRTQKGKIAFDRCREAFVCEKCSYDSVQAAQNVLKSDPGLPPYHVFVDGVGFNNKGAWMMLEAIVQAVRSRVPHAVITIPFGEFYVNSEWCLKHQILPLLKTGNANNLKERLYRFVARIPGLRGRIPVLTPSDIDLVLDAAGYKYSDKFGKMTDDRIQSELRYYQSFNKEGRKIILLPQAFGPFDSEMQVKRMKTLCTQFDLIFAREEVSFQNMIELLGPSSSIRMAPDFTCLYHPSDSELLPTGKYAVVIPNTRMMISTEKHISNAYLNFLLAVIRHLSDRGLSVVLLNHEGLGDSRIIKTLSTLSKVPVVVRDKMTACGCKSIISKATIVLSSRFHGAVSGLTSGVPTLCTSWSHKYQELVKDLGVSGNCVDVSDKEGVCRIIDDVLHEPNKYTVCEERLRRLRHDVIEMWHLIFNALPSNIPYRPMQWNRSPLLFNGRYIRMRHLMTKLLLRPLIAIARNIRH